MIEFNNSSKSIFTANGFKTVDDFLSYTEGEIVSKPGKRVVRKMTLGDQIFFIKQEYFEGFKVLFKRLRKTGSLHSSLFKESKIIDLCQNAEIPVMEKAVFAEKYKFGIPVGGVLVVNEVKGKEFYKTFNDFSISRKRILAKAFGYLIGSIHRAGIDTIVRTHDLLIEDVNLKNYRECLVLIDREHGEINKKQMPEKDCALQIAKILIKSSGYLNHVPKSCLMSFINGYQIARSLDKLRIHKFSKLINEFILKELNKEKYLKNKNTIESLIEP